MNPDKENHLKHEQYLMKRALDEVASGLTLEKAESDLKEYEAGIFESIGLEPDGDVRGYLTDADFQLEARLDYLDMRVAVLYERKMHADARALLSGRPKKFEEAA